MLRSRAVALIGISIMIAACSSAPPIDTAADEDAIRQVAAQEMAASNAGDIDAFLAVMSDDVVFMAPNEPTQRGADAHEWLRGMLDQVAISDAGYTDERIVVSGDLAYHTYDFEWTLTPKAGGGPMREEGHGVHILRRQADGSWKITLDSWSSTEPPPAPAEAS